MKTAPAREPRTAPLAVLVELVDQAGGQAEGRAQQEVAQLARTVGAGDEQVQQVLHQTDHHAVHGAEGEGGQQSGQLGKVHFYEGRDEGHGEVQEHQDEGHGGQHGAHGHGPGVETAAGRAELVTEAVLGSDIIKTSYEI